MSMIISCNDEKVPPDTANNYFNVISFETDALKGEKLEIALYEKELKIANTCNPYNYDEIRVMFVIKTPSNETLNIPAFWYQGYTISFNTLGIGSPSGISGVASTSKDEPQGTEMISPLGDPHYRVRFIPEEAGIYSYVIQVYRDNKLVSKEHESTFEVIDTNKEINGVLKCSNNQHTLEFSKSNKVFTGVGQNACWYTSSTRKTKDYEVWFKLMNENNMNLSRIWMATWGFCLHWGKSYSDFSGRFAQAARLDNVFDLAEKYNIYFIFSLINHGQFSALVNPEWDKNPYNVENGGICSSPLQFFILDEAKQAYKNELLYIIARYGYSNNIISFELFNEVDWIDGYTLGAMKVKSWHQEMAQFIKASDPFNHLVSTSYKGTDGNANALDELDFVSPHDYSYSNKNLNESLIKTITSLQSKYNKPVLFGELGLKGGNGYENYEQDKTGIHLHQSQWIGLMAGSATAAMNWWWDSYVHPYNLYSNFKGAGTYAKEMDLSGCDFKLISNDDSVNNSNLSIIGYKFNNRCYGYIYDNMWTYYNKNIINKTNVQVTITDINDGQYKVYIYNTNTGDITSSFDVKSTSHTITFNIDSVQYDTAFIIK